MQRTLFLVFALTVTACTLTAAEPKEKGDKPAHRRFNLTYAATVTGLPEAAEVRVWFPVPQSSEDQTVKVLERELPGEVDEGAEEKFGNRMLTFKTVAPKSGEIEMSAAYQVERKEVRGL